MKTDIGESKIAQSLVCLTVLILFLGAEYYILSAREPAEPDYVKKSDTVTSRQVNSQVSTSAQLNNVLTDKRILLRMNSLFGVRNANASVQQSEEHFNWALELVRTIEKANPALHSVALLDTSGTVISHTDTRQMSSNWAHRKFFRDAMRGEVGTETTYSEKPPTALKIVAVPVKLNGKVIGVLCAAMDISK